tara:strand:+ start:6909 stop:7289 length:381 start_codon:yes stop_codon:yes gene_type:complete
MNNNTMIIDVIPLFTTLKIKTESEKILTEISSFVPNIELLIINVGKKLTISMVERNLSFIKKLALLLYSMDNNMKTCQLVNTPRTFSTIFSFIKPFITKDALKKICVHKDNPINNSENSINVNMNN